MKKILAVLVVLAMVLSLSAVAFAADQVDVLRLTVDSTQASKDSTRFQFETGVAVNGGDKVEVVLSTDGLGAEVTDWLLRGEDKYSVEKVGEEKATKATGYSTDGKWVKLTATVPDNHNANTLKLTITVDATNATNVDILYIKVGNTTYTPAELTGVAAWDGKPYLSAEVVKADAPVVGGDVTEDVEKTGVVSVAVVAVAAVVGGAVVLKKREF